jgi:hypothetical protein
MMIPVAGAVIGGLTAALSLHAAGARLHVGPDGRRSDPRWPLPLTRVCRDDEGAQRTGPRLGTWWRGILSAARRTNTRKVACKNLGDLKPPPAKGSKDERIPANRQKVLPPPCTNK